MDFEKAVLIILLGMGVAFSLLLLMLAYYMYADVQLSYANCVPQTEVLRAFHE